MIFKKYLKKTNLKEERFTLAQFAYVFICLQCGEPWHGMYIKPELLVLGYLGRKEEGIGDPTGPTSLV